LVVQANLKSNVAVDHMTIGQAAERLGLKPSALRYYDERGLVSVPVRRAGRRMYGPDELRRLAFIKIGQRLGLPLDTAAEVFDAPGVNGTSGGAGTELIAGILPSPCASPARAKVSQRARLARCPQQRQYPRRSMSRECSAGARSGSQGMHATRFESSAKSTAPT
jgi:DNA-binding transcriptional MerR regulator